MWFASTFCGMYAMCVSTQEDKEPEPHGAGVNCLQSIVSNPLWELKSGKAEELCLAHLRASKVDLKCRIHRDFYRN